MIEEILLSIPKKEWNLIKSGRKTIVIQKTKPQKMFYPFRVIVYVTEWFGVVGKFDCDEIRQTIRPEDFLKDSCLTANELYAYAAGSPVCAWHIQEESVVEYDFPFPLIATGFDTPPESWRYMNRDDDA